jgi:hypothetical protein
LEDAHTWLGRETGEGRWRSVESREDAQGSFAKGERVTVLSRLFTPTADQVERSWS